MAIGIRISLKGLQQTVSRLQAITAAGLDAGGSKTELHRRYGIQAMKWIHENFQQEGGLLEDGKWQELSENTIAARRGGSSQILQNTRANLLPSFSANHTSTEVRIGSPSKLALWHNEGTKGPYPIEPKNKKALAFAVSAHFAQYAQTTNFNSSAQTSTTIKRAGVVTRKIAQRSARFGTGHLRVGGNFVLATKVMHPGLVKRRMLPNENELLPRLLKTTENWVAQLGQTASISVENE